MYHIVSPKKIEKYIILHYFYDILLLFYLFGEYYLGVSINRGTPKWMVYKGKFVYKWMICGYPFFRKAPNIEIGATKLRHNSSPVWTLNCSSPAAKVPPP